MEQNVVNNTAERGIALIQSFNSVLAKHENQIKYPLQIVENHRQRFPNPNRSTLINNLF